MKKKILIFTVTFLFVAMIVSPVFAFGPINPEQGKNKNRLHGITDNPEIISVTNWNQIIEPGTLPRAGVFKSWMIVKETGQKATYQRLHADRFHIGNAVDGTDLPFDNYWGTDWNDPVGAFMELANAGNWVYLDSDAYQSYLRAYGYSPIAAYWISHMYTPEGAYFKATIVGK